jgi:hypothetical protein
VVFLKEQIAKNGGHVDFAGTNVHINCSWRFRSDRNGGQIFTDAKFYPVVDSLFRVALGSPDQGATNAKEEVFVRYNIERAGVLIQYTVAPSPFNNIPDPLLHIIILNKQGYLHL